MTVRYINRSAVNVTWTPVTESNFSINGYTVHYSSVAVDRVTTSRRCSGSVFFDHNRDLTSYGIITDLSEVYHGYEFTVLIETSSGTLGEITDFTPVIGLQENRSSTTDAPTGSECKHLIWYTHKHIHASIIM